MEMPLFAYVLLAPAVMVIVVFMGSAGWLCRSGTKDQKIRLVLLITAMVPLIFLGPVVGGIVDFAYLPVLYTPFIIGWCVMCVMAFVPHPYDIVRTVSR